MCFFALNIFIALRVTCLLCHSTTVNYDVNYNVNYTQDYNVNFPWSNFYSDEKTLLKSYVWDRTKLSAHEYLMGYCPFQCKDGAPVFENQDKECLELTCFPCDCTRPRCLIYGTCCPEALKESSNRTLQKTEVAQIEAPTGTARVGCGSKSEKLSGFLFVGSCPADFTDQSVVTRCNEYDASSWGNLDVITRVTDDVTNISYANKFCAQCNGARELTSWHLHVLCEHYLRVYQAMNQDELLTLSLSPNSSCTLSSSPTWHPMDTLAECHISWFGSVVDQCNVTGNWAERDVIVEDACAEISGHAYKVKYSNIVYQNIFCAVCNMDQPPTYFTKGSCGGRSPEFLDLTPPLTILLGFTAQSVTSSDPSCWTGHDDTCRPLQCSPGKALVNGQCSTAVPAITGLWYRHKLWYSLHLMDSNASIHHQHSNAHRKFIPAIEGWVESVLGGKSTDAILSLTLALKSLNTTSNVSSSTDLHRPFACLIDLHFTANQSLGRDEIEDYFVTTFLQQNATVTTENGVRVLLTPMPSLAPHSPESNTTVTSNKYLFYPSITLSRPEVWSILQEFLPLTSLLSCPYVVFTEPDYTLQHQPDGSLHVMLYVNKQQIYFSNQQLFFIVKCDNETLCVCKNVLQEQLSSINNSKVRGLVPYIQYILTLCCMCLSVFFLAATLMTYFLFGELRSTAGIHNMFLSGSLLAAQTLLLTITHVRGPGTVCTILGVSTHFLWLHVFCWSLVCCFHMFRTFTSKTGLGHTSASRQRVNIVKKVLFCIAVPVAIIITVIVSQYVTSGGVTIGYGQSACYLNTGLLVAVSLVAPLAVILLLNTIFFSKTVFEIHKIRKLQSADNFKKEDHKNVYVYIKLSTITGAFWVISILAEGLENDPLRFIAIVLNGLQGVFIFLSYICNSRVMRLYCPHGRMKPEHPSTFTSQLGSVRASK